MTDPAWMAYRFDKGGLKMVTAPDALDLFCPTQEHRMLKEEVRDFVRSKVEPKASFRDQKEYFDITLFQQLGKLGLLGITVPLEYGGSGMDKTAAVIAHEELAFSDPGFCLAYLAHSMLCVNNLAVNADEALKKRVLPKLCSGEWIGAMAMSEPGVGTDVLSMQTKAMPKGDGYILDGRKMWITNGCLNAERTKAHCVFVYAKTGERQGKPLISSFLVEQTHPGFEVGQLIHGKLGMRASLTAELVFEACQVPKANRIGEEGESTLHMMRNLEIERLALAAMSLGIAKRCLMVMNQYAQERKAFQKPLWHFGQVQEHIAQSYAEYQACRAYVYTTAYQLDHNLSPNGRLDSDGAKLVCAPMAKRVADRAIQVLGGNGYISEYQVERFWRDAKLLEIGGGTLEALQKNMASDLAKNSHVMEQ